MDREDPAAREMPGTPMMEQLLAAGWSFVSFQFDCLGQADRKVFNCDRIFTIRTATRLGNLKMKEITEKSRAVRGDRACSSRVQVKTRR